VKYPGPVKIRDYKQQRIRLVDGLSKRGYIRSESVKEAMLSVARELFVPEIVRDDAYADRPLPIRGGQTISAPHMVAEMCELADLESGMKVLEIGAGSGYQAAVMSRVIDPGLVFTTDVVADLVKIARQNLEQAGIDNVRVEEHDGSIGLKDEAPFHRIMVTCASPGVPSPLLKQLAPGGILLIPVGDLFLQTLTLVRKDARGKLHHEKRMGCVFVPMRGKHGFK
jgi:protein-L-isoaspartate(D-aspartate) O-methyltransferase